MILPGSCLGMLGGGQLGRMFTLSALAMGYQVLVLDPDPQSPAGKIATQHVCADFTDEDALRTLGQHCAAISTEFENVPAQSLRFLAELTSVSPAATAIEVAQNRIQEKNFFNSIGLLTTPYAPVRCKADLPIAWDAVQGPSILKSATLGYDGKGQIQTPDLPHLLQAFEDLDEVECVLEGRVDLAAEVSVLVARNANGQNVSYPVAENQHRDGILHLSVAPARIDAALAEKARQQTLKIADALNYVGVLAVEFFVSEQGHLIVNEMAPRPHNSAHFTQDACLTSQFEQQVRMMCNLAPGATDLVSPVAMVNLLGDLWPENAQPDWTQLLQEPNLKLHVYAKQEARAGRKMAHFNLLADSADAAVAQADAIFQRIATIEKTA